jgi:hypothetical protein
MTVYALFVGTATVLTGWLPDIPFILIGLYAFILILIDRFRRSRKLPQGKTEMSNPETTRQS